MSPFSSCCEMRYGRGYLRLLSFFFNDTAPTEIYTLSLHDALPILKLSLPGRTVAWYCVNTKSTVRPRSSRSEEHTSELQSRQYLVCRLLLEKKKNGGTSQLERGGSHDAALHHSLHGARSHRGSDLQ